MLYFISILCAFKKMTLNNDYFETFADFFFLQKILLRSFDSTEPKYLSLKYPPIIAAAIIDITLTTVLIAFAFL